MKYTEILRNTDLFCLHDSKVSKIEFIDHNLELTFSEGFWETNEFGKLVRQRKHCKITFKFIIPEDDELNLNIFKRNGWKIKEIMFADFSAIVNKYGFRLYREFRCNFSTQLILEGNTDKGNYSIITQEINEIVYECDDN